ARVQRTSRSSGGEAWSSTDRSCSGPTSALIASPCVSAVLIPAWCHLARSARRPGRGAAPVRVDERFRKKKPGISIDDNASASLKSTCPASQGRRRESVNAHAPRRQPCSRLLKRKGDQRSDAPSLPLHDQRGSVSPRLPTPEHRGSGP